MQQVALIEPINTSTWFLNMVVFFEYNGAIRIFCDFSDLNNAVIHDCYPLTTIDELCKLFPRVLYFRKNQP